ncbi:MAG: hypothetical protein HYT27_02655 [Parcubacteria group bacterium]|nr:hypothetical protein [Parcubacteria group bacterium]
MNLERRDMHIGGSKGRELEIGLFDALRADDPAYRDLFLKYANRNTGKVEFEQSLELVKNFQPADPEKPNRPFASWLLRSTREILGLKDEDAKKAKFYTSVAPSSLPAKVAPRDFWYGIDAFIEIEQEKGGFRRVTLDATEKNKKDLL